MLPLVESKLKWKGVALGWLGGMAGTVSQLTAPQPARNKWGEKTDMPGNSPLCKDAEEPSACGAGSSLGCLCWRAPQRLAE